VLTIGDLTVDAVFTETHTLTAEVSNYPTEGGRNLTDNKRVMPLTLSLDGMISDTPIGEALIAQRNQETAGLISPSQWAYAKLEQIHSAGQIVDIQTSLRLYKNMVTTSVTITRDAMTGKALAFQIAAQQIDVVSTVRTTIRARGPGGGVNRGSQLGLPYGYTTKFKNGVGTIALVYDKGYTAEPRFVYADGSNASFGGSADTASGTTDTRNIRRGAVPVELDKRGVYKNQKFANKTGAGRRTPSYK
jgi:hypothetical protein